MWWSRWHPPPWRGPQEEQRTGRETATRPDPSSSFAADHSRAFIGAATSAVDWRLAGGRMQLCLAGGGHTVVRSGPCVRVDSVLWLAQDVCQYLWRSTERYGCERGISPVSIPSALTVLVRSSCGRVAPRTPHPAAPPVPAEAPG